MKYPPELITWCYSEWQPLYEELQLKCPTVQFHQGLPDLNELRGQAKDVHKLLILDDVMNSISEQDLSNLFTKLSHHCNCTVVYLAQNLYHKGSRTARMNSQYIVLFKSPQDKCAVQSLARQIYPGKTRFFIDAFEDATRAPFGYLLCDMTQQTPDAHRLCSNIFGETRRDYVVLYRTAVGV
ncbi:MAG: hypothetical protein GY696_07155 [Gammaproteobacteria bacterium]|nr:hypothetical protein [Gammaproteobacteria bacterium]